MSLAACLGFDTRKGTIEGLRARITRCKDYGRVSSINVVRIETERRCS
jgi:hypothetical protein